MRAIGAAAAAARRHPHLPQSYAAAFSSFSGIGGGSGDGGGAGRGRGHGLPPPPPSRAPGRPISDDDGGHVFSVPAGRGRGEPGPSFSSFSGAGRGRGSPLPPPPPPRSPPPADDSPKPPIFTKPSDVVPPPEQPRAPGNPIPDDDGGAAFSVSPVPAGRGRGEPGIPFSPAAPSFSSFSGAGHGRGSPLPPPPPSEDAPRQPIFIQPSDVAQPPSDLDPPMPRVSSPEMRHSIPHSGVGHGPRPSMPLSGVGRGLRRMEPQVEMAPEENRFARRKQRKQSSASPLAPSGQPKLSSEEALKRAMEILGRGGGSRGGARGARGSRGGAVRGVRWSEDVDDKVYMGDNADGEKLEKHLGADKMMILDQAFDEAAENCLPDPMEDAFLDAAHTNNMIEFEPEYHANFDNPVIDEKPPMPLEEVLQQVKPFIIAYEGIQNEQEWEDAVKDVMVRAPHMEELIDMYSGPDVVTAKQQEEELQRLGNTLPEKIPSSVKRFTDKTLLSLKNNPGWGFDKKYQFMDKFVREVSEQYK